MKLGVGAVKFGPRAGVNMKLLQHAESLGFDSAWTGEAYGNDAVTTAAWALANTTRIRVGTAIMQMSARSPAMTAMTAISLDHMSEGRFILGIGASGPQVVEGWHGVPYGKPIARTREYITVLRRVFEREKPLEFHGEHYSIPNTGPGTTGLGKSLKTILHPPASVPIYTASVTPTGIRLAAEIADGVLPQYSPDFPDLVMGPVREGLTISGRSIKEFAICPTVSVVLEDDLDKARLPIKHFLALYIGGMGARGKNFYNDNAKRLGYEEAAVRIQDYYLSGDTKAAIAAVPDKLVDELHLVGSEDRIRDRLQAWKEAANRGEIDTLIINTQQLRALEVVAEEIL